MKKSTAKVKHILPYLILSVILISIISFNFYLSFELSQKPSRWKETKYSEKEEPKKDKPGEAYYLEFLKTRDLKTNTVPTERLIRALEYTKELQSFQVDGPIPGITWKERGPNNLGGRTRAILVDRRDTSGKTVFSGGVGGGLWKTTDITQVIPNWVKTDDFFSNLAISCIVQNPLNLNEMYFGTGEGWYNIDAIRGLGIWKSSNGGINWSQLSSTNNSNFYHIQKISIHPVTGAIFAATRSNGVMRSMDGGSSWQQVLGPPTSIDVRAADIEIAADNSIYASMGGVIWTDGIYKSINNGTNWTKLNTPISGFPLAGFGRLEIACAPNNANRLYVIASNIANYGILGIYRSDNGGTTFISLPLPVDGDPLIGADYTRSQAWYDLASAVDPNNADVFYVGGIDLFKTTTGGAAWQQISHWYGGFTFQDVHADQHAIIFKHGSSSQIYFGNDGGVYYTSNGTASIPTLRSKESNYNTAQFYGCAIHPGANTTHFLAGAQDNGSHRFTSAGINSTVEVTGGDGAFCNIDQNQPQFQWTQYVYNSYFRSTDGGGSFTAVDINGDGQFINPTDYDDTTNIMYCGNAAGGYLRWNDPQTGSSSNVVTVSGFNGASVTAVRVSFTTRNRVFFGTDSGAVVRVDSANVGTAKTGVVVSTGLPKGYVSCIELDQANDNHILVTYSNYGLTSIWESNNGGSSWTSVEGNIPDMPVRWIIFNPANSDQALAATETGVWSTDNLNGASTDWGPSNNGLANVSTHMLQYRTSDKMIIAASHGRGLFSTDAFSSPAADFTSDRTVSYLGKNIQFSDNSTQSASWLWNFGDGGTSTSQNPQHAYSSAGFYSVTLTINSGASVKTKTDYIKILPNRGTPYAPSNGGNFETNLNDFIPENISGTMFQRGNSTVTGKNGTQSGTNAWVTGLTEAQYQNGTHCNLYSPNYNFTAAGTYTIKFYAKYSTELAWDGFRVEVTTNKGDSWAYVGTLGVNWYNFPNNVQPTVFPVNEPYFSGVQPNYTQYFTNVSLAGQSNVAFRIVFKTDANTPDIGAAFDDFEIAGPVNGIVGVEPQNTEIPSVYGLAQNFPNPFNPATDIKFQIPQKGLVKLIIYDILGREVSMLINQIKDAGYYKASFDGTNLASGVYFYTIEVTPSSSSAVAFKDVKKMVLVK